MASARAAAHHKHEAPSLIYNLGALAMGAAMAGLGLAYGIDALGRNARPSADPVHSEQLVGRTLAGRQLAIPASWLASGTAYANGFAKQIDLIVTIPVADGGATEVAVTLLPRSQARPSSSLLDGVYLHQFMPEQVNGPPGLIGKPLMAADGYAGETVWYDPISPKPFVAKCIAPVAGAEDSRCLRTVYVGTGIAAVYDFEIGALDTWRQFDAEMEARLKRIGAL
ncbi:MAG: hypothetical protein ABL879_09660 [Devosia sp.]